jgi:group I intron endonuclease
MRTYYIYKYTNLAHPKKKIYIGQTVNIKIRQIAHKCAALSGGEESPLFYHAIRKYGYQNFKCEIIEIVYDQKTADDREIFWIKELDARNPNVGMNIAEGGRGGSGGRKYECNTDTHKYCPRCTKIKLRNGNFSNNRYNSDGLASYCKICVIESKKEKWELLSENEKVEYVKTRSFKRSQQNINKLNEQIRAAKLNQKVKNEKFTKEEIYFRTPIKFCPGFCQKEIDSINFNIDIYTKDGLVNKCRNCIKTEVLKRKAKKEE